MIKAFKYKLDPNVEQRKTLNEFFGATRFIYNWGLGLEKNAYEIEKKYLGYINLAKQLTLLKQEAGFDWIGNTPIQSLQQSLRHLDKAFQRFFKDKKGFPAFKSKKYFKRACQFNRNLGFDFENWLVKIPKVGWVKIKKNRVFDPNAWKLGTMTISQDSCGTLWVTILCKNDESFPAKAKLEKSSAIGIDLGLKEFAILSNGEKVKNHKFARKTARRLASLQKSMMRKVIGSGRYNRARLAVARCYRHLVNQRLNFLHEFTTWLTRDSKFKTFCIEDLNVKGMVRNHKLARSINDVCWATFRRLMEYKCDWYGKNLLVIDRFAPSSKKCSRCGYINNELTLKVREWKCPQCGAFHDRDINAAINIKEIAFEAIAS